MIWFLSHLIRNLAWALAYLSGLQGQWKTNMGKHLEWQNWPTFDWQNWFIFNLIDLFVTLGSGDASPHGGSHPLWSPMNTSSLALHTCFSISNLLRHCFFKYQACSPPGYPTQAMWHGGSLLFLQHEVVEHQLGVQPLAVSELHQPMRVPDGESELMYSVKY